MGFRFARRSALVAGILAAETGQLGHSDLLSREGFWKHGVGSYIHGRIVDAPTCSFSRRYPLPMPLWTELPLRAISQVSGGRLGVDCPIITADKRLAQLGNGYDGVIDARGGVEGVRLPTISDAGQPWRDTGISHSEKGMSQGVTDETGKVEVET